MKNSIKKILITHSSNDHYGASKVLINTTDVLINNGFDIYLMLPNNGPLNDNQIIKKTNLKIINLGVFRKKYLTFFGLINRLYFIIKSSLFIKKFLKRNQIDLVYTNTSTLISPAIAAKLHAIPSIYHIHEIPNSNYIYLRFMTAFLNNFSRNIICVSKSVKEFWLKKGLNKNKLNLINNGFLFKKSKSKNLSKDKIIFTSISRIIPYKGHELLIDLFDLLCKKNNRINLQIIGDTLPEYQKYLDNLKLKVDNSSLNDRIKFMGFKNNIISVLSKSNFFIHTPISPDPFPTVIIEAIQTMTPVVTNDKGGAYEMLDNGKNGLIIQNQDIQKSVIEILEFINDKNKHKENTQSALNYAIKNFTKEKFENNILNIIG